MKTFIVVVFCAIICSTYAFYDSSDDVIELTPENFNRDMIGSSDLWLIEFYAPWCGHCQTLAPEWKKAASALKGIVKVGAVDMDKYGNLGQPYNVRGFPTIKIFGANKNNPQDYNADRSAQSIVDTALSHLQSLVRTRLSGGGSGGGSSSRNDRNSGGSSGGSGDGAVVELTDANFEEQVLKSKDFWLVEFYAPWCGHCKTLKPHWDSAARSLGGKVKLGALDATVHTVVSGRYGIQGFPTIKVFGAGKKDGSAEEYDGGRTADDIVRWATEKHSDSIPAPEVIQLTSDQALKTACEGQICIVSILPNILDCQSKCRNKYLTILKALGEKFKKQQWGWMWAQATSQKAIETAFDLGGFGYPTMVAVNARKLIYAQLKGPFSETGINEFLRAVSMGRGGAVPMRGSKLPTAVKLDAWDGKDGQLPKEEEEIDLSELGIKTEL